jgi:hypothetical protein
MVFLPLCFVVEDKKTRNIIRHEQYFKGISRLEVRETEQRETTYFAISVIGGQSAVDILRHHDRQTHCCTHG